MPVKLLLCTDLDRTLLPNGPQPESPAARKMFNQLVAHSGVTLVYVSGRDRGLVEDAIRMYHLPQPGFVIADVGSTIYEQQEGDLCHWENWEQEISVDWQGKSHQDLSLLFTDIQSLTMQEDSRQNKHKLSYYVSLETDHRLLISEMYTILGSLNIKASIIWSIDELTGTGLLDILPAKANKQHAIEFLMDRLGFDLSNTVFAGDSGNDLSVLTGPIQSVLVANASNTVRDEARKIASTTGQMNSLYFAKGGFLGMNGNYSAGILEGLAHYIPEACKLLCDQDEY